MLLLRLKKILISVRKGYRQDELVLAEVLKVLVVHSQQIVEDLLVDGSELFVDHPHAPRPGAFAL